MVFHLCSGIKRLLIRLQLSVIEMLKCSPRQQLYTKCRKGKEKNLKKKKRKKMWHLNFCELPWMDIKEVQMVQLHDCFIRHSLLQIYNTKMGKEHSLKNVKYFDLLTEFFLNFLWEIWNKSFSKDNSANFNGNYWGWLMFTTIGTISSTADVWIGMHVSTCFMHHRYCVYFWIFHFVEGCECPSWQVARFV